MSNTNTETKTKRMSWSEKENTELLEGVKNRGEKSLTAVFNDFSQKYSRPASSIAQHYYQMSKNNTVKAVNKKSSASAAIKTNEHTTTKKTANKDNSEVNILIKKIRKMPNKAINSLSYIVNNMNVQ